MKENLQILCCPRQKLVQFNMESYTGENISGLQYMQSGVSQDTNSQILAELKSINNKIERMSVDINKRIDDLEKTLDGKITDIKQEVQADITKIQGDVQSIATKIEKKERFDPERTVVISSLPMLEGEDNGKLYRSVEHMLSTKCGLSGEGSIEDTFQIVRKHGLVKAEFYSVGQKVSVLKAKSSLRRFPEYAKVFIRTSKSHTERVNELNIKKILDLIPGGKDFIVSSSGKIMSKQDVINRAKETVQSVDNKRKRIGSIPASLGPTLTKVPTGSTHLAPISNQMIDGGYEQGYGTQVQSSPFIMQKTPEVNYGGLNYYHHSYSTPVQSNVSNVAVTSTYHTQPAQDLRLSFAPDNTQNSVKFKDGYRGSNQLITHQEAQGIRHKSHPMPNIQSSVT